MVGCSTAVCKSEPGPRVTIMVTVHMCIYCLFQHDSRLLLNELYINEPYTGKSINVAKC